MRLRIQDVESLMGGELARPGGATEEGAREKDLLPLPGRCRIKTASPGLRFCVPGTTVLPPPRGLPEAAHSACGALMRSLVQEQWAEIREGRGVATVAVPSCPSDREGSIIHSAGVPSAPYQMIREKTSASPCM